MLVMTADVAVTIAAATAAATATTNNTNKKQWKKSICNFMQCQEYSFLETKYTFKASYKHRQQMFIEFYYP